MFAAFVCEMRGLQCPFACFQPEEALLSHRVLTAALLSQKEKRAVSVAEIG